MKEQLKRFKKEHKKFKDEKFKYSTYPGISKYSIIVTNKGRVFSFVSGKEKKQYPDKDGYLRVSIKIQKSKKVTVQRAIGVHRLIAWDFCKRIKGKNLVNHKDGKKSNNDWTNLEWCTPKENTQHAIKNGLQCNSGVNCPSAIYPEDLVRSICSDLEDGKSCEFIYKKMTNHDKIKDRALYALIFSIKQGNRHREISSEYNFIKGSDVSSSKKKFTKEDSEKLKNMILNGDPTSKIVKEFGVTKSRDKYGHRIYDKIRHLRIKLNIPDPGKIKDESSTTIESIA